MNPGRRSPPIENTAAEQFAKARKAERLDSGVVTPFGVVNGSTATGLQRIQQIASPNDGGRFTQSRLYKCDCKRNLNTRPDGASGGVSDANADSCSFDTERVES